MCTRPRAIVPISRREEAFRCRAPSGSFASENSRTLITVFGVPAVAARARRQLPNARTMLVLLAIIAAVVLAVIRSVRLPGMWGDTNANISTALPWLTARHDRSDRLRRGVRLRRARAPGRCALPIKFQPALLLMPSGFVSS